MIVGGTVNLTGGDGGEVPGSAGATISAGSPSTIRVHFPNLSEGGYFVNGIEGLIFDESTQTGFLVFGEPGILNENLFFTYNTEYNTELPDYVIAAINFFDDAVNKKRGKEKDDDEDDEGTVDKGGLPTCA
jgi:hypothetical protein